ncbi:hypothetical protein OJ998_15620 [Solirubrobacter taibaiensis]|nr:hypothetical protein [Solirubrobacter taibaiensis]
MNYGGDETFEAVIAATVPGQTVDIERHSGGNWAVVTRRNGGSLWIVVCKRENVEWIVEDAQEISASEQAPRSSWTSLLDDEDLDGDNVGVEVTWGAAPPDVVRGLLFVGGEQFAVDVVDGRYWLVRWDVADPAESDDWGADHIDFTAA